METANRTDGGQQLMAPLGMASLTLSASASPAILRPHRGYCARLPRTTGKVVRPRGMPMPSGAAPAAIPTPKCRSRHALRSFATAVPRALIKAITGSNSKLVRRSAALGAAALLACRAIPAMVPWLAGGGRQPRSDGGGARSPSVVWFRSDLRLHDHEALHRANQGSTSVLPVYIFDPREYSKAPSGFDKTGPHRARFVLESVQELRRRLRELGSDLLVRVGHPEQVLPALVREVQAGTLYCHSDVAYESAALESRVKAAVQREGAQFKGHWGCTLYHVEDLPFRLKGMPGCYADFRTRVQGVAVRQALPAPQSLKGMPLGSSLEPGEVPSLQQLGFGAVELAALQQGQRTAALQRTPELRGGEGEALQHLRMFLSSAAPNLAGGSAASGSFSCQISPWLSAGCLSPRFMYQELSKLAQGVPAAPLPAKAQGQGQQPQQPGAWLVFELMWRDFFCFVTHKYTQMGLKGKNPLSASAVNSNNRVMASQPAMAAA